MFSHDLLIGLTCMWKRGYRSNYDSMAKSTEGRELAELRRFLRGDAEKLADESHLGSCSTNHRAWSTALSTSSARLPCSAALPQHSVARCGSIVSGSLVIGVETRHLMCTRSNGTFGVYFCLLVGPKANPALQVWMI